MARKATAALTAVCVLFTAVSSSWAEAGFWETRRAARGRSTQVAAVPSSSPFSLPGLEAATASQVVTHALPGDAQQDPLLAPLKGSNLLKSLPLANTTVRDVYIPAGGFTHFVIHIQDIHGQRQAQDNISKSIQFIEAEARRHGGRALVGVEGAAGAFLTDAIRSFSGPDGLGGVVEPFYEKGVLTGAEEAALMGPTAPELWGLENAALYRRHVAAVKEGFPVEGDARDLLKRLESRLAKEKQAAYSPALKAWDDRFSGYHNGSVSLGDYVQASAEGLSLSRRPQLALFLKALVREKALDFKAAESERRALVEGLTRRLDQDALKGLMERAVDFRLGRLGYADFHRILTATAARAGLSMTGYPAFAEYVQYVGQVEKIDRAALLKEIDVLEQDAAQRALTGASDRVRALHEASADLNDVKKLFTRTMTPADWDRYSARRDQALRLPARLDEKEDGFVGMVDLFERFYTAAVARNEALVDNLLSKSGSRRANGPRISTLVAGGFHTDGMTALLKKKNVAYVVLAPRFDEIEEHNYLEVFREDKTPLARLFESEKITVNAPLETPSRPLKDGPGAGLYALSVGAVKLLDGDPGKIKDALQKRLDETGLSESVRVYRDQKHGYVDVTLSHWEGAEEKIFLSLRIWNEQRAGTRPLAGLWVEERVAQPSWFAGAARFIAKARNAMDLRAPALDRLPGWVPGLLLSLSSFVVVYGAILAVTAGSALLAAAGAVVLFGGFALILTAMVAMDPKATPLRTARKFLTVGTVLAAAGVFQTLLQGVDVVGTAQTAFAALAAAPLLALTLRGAKAPTALKVEIKDSELIHDEATPISGISSIDRRQMAIAQAREADRAISVPAVQVAAAAPAVDADETGTQVISGRPGADEVEETKTEVIRVGPAAATRKLSSEITQSSRLEPQKPVDEEAVTGKSARPAVVQIPAAAPAMQLAAGETEESDTHPLFQGLPSMSAIPHTVVSDGKALIARMLAEPSPLQQTFFNVEPTDTLGHAIYPNRQIIRVSGNRVSFRIPGTPYSALETVGMGVSTIDVYEDVETSDGSEKDIVRLGRYVTDGSRVLDYTGIPEIPKGLEFRNRLTTLPVAPPAGQAEEEEPTEVLPAPAAAQGAKVIAFPTRKKALYGVSAVAAAAAALAISVGALHGSHGNVIGQAAGLKDLSAQVAENDVIDLDAVEAAASVVAQADIPTVRLDQLPIEAAPKGPKAAPSQPVKKPKTVMVSTDQQAPVEVARDGVRADAMPTDPALLQYFKEHVQEKGKSRGKTRVAEKPLAPERPQPVAWNGQSSFTGKSSSGGVGGVLVALGGFLVRGASRRDRARAAVGVLAPTLASFMVLFAYVALGDWIAPALHSIGGFAHILKPLLYAVPLFGVLASADLIKGLLAKVGIKSTNLPPLNVEGTGAEEGRTRTPLSLVKTPSQAERVAALGPLPDPSRLNSQTPPVMKPASVPPPASRAPLRAVRAAPLENIHLEPFSEKVPAAPPVAPPPAPVRGGTLRIAPPSRTQPLERLELALLSESPAPESAPASQKAKGLVGFFASEAELTKAAGGFMYTAADDKGEAHDFHVSLHHRREGFMVQIGDGSPVERLLSFPLPLDLSPISESAVRDIVELAADFLVERRDTESFPNGGYRLTDYEDLGTLKPVTLPEASAAPVEPEADFSEWEPTGVDNQWRWTGKDLPYDLRSSLVDGGENGAVFVATDGKSRILVPVRFLTDRNLNALIALLDTWYEREEHNAGDMVVDQSNAAFLLALADGHRQQGAFIPEVVWKDISRRLRAQAASWRERLLPPSSASPRRDTMPPPARHDGSGAFKLDELVRDVTPLPALLPGSDAAAEAARAAFYVIAGDGSSPTASLAPFKDEKSSDVREIKPKDGGEPPSAPKFSLGPRLFDVEKTAWETKWDAEEQVWRSHFTHTLAGNDRVRLIERRDKSVIPEQIDFTFVSVETDEVLHHSSFSEPFLRDLAREDAAKQKERVMLFRAGVNKVLAARLGGNAESRGVMLVKGGLGDDRPESSRSGEVMASWAKAVSRSMTGLPAHSADRVFGIFADHHWDPRMERYEYWVPGKSYKVYERPGANGSSKFWVVATAGPQRGHLLASFELSADQPVQPERLQDFLDARAAFGLQEGEKYVLTAQDIAVISEDRPFYVAGSAPALTPFTFAALEASAQAAAGEINDTLPDSLVPAQILMRDLVRVGAYSLVTPTARLERSRQPELDEPFSDMAEDLGLEPGREPSFFEDYLSSLFKGAPHAEVEVEEDNSDETLNRSLEAEADEDIDSSLITAGMAMLGPRAVTEQVTDGVVKTSVEGDPYYILEYKTNTGTMVTFVHRTSDGEAAPLVSTFVRDGRFPTAETMAIWRAYLKTWVETRSSGSENPLWVEDPSRPESFGDLFRSTEISSKQAYILIHKIFPAIQIAEAQVPQSLIGLVTQAFQAAATEMVEAAAVDPRTVSETVQELFDPRFTGFTPVAPEVRQFFPAEEAEEEVPTSPSTSVRDGKAALALPNPGRTTEQGPQDPFEMEMRARVARFQEQVMQEVQRLSEDRIARDEQWSRAYEAKAAEADDLRAELESVKEGKRNGDAMLVAIAQQHIDDAQSAREEAERMSRSRTRGWIFSAVLMVVIAGMALVISFLRDGIRDRSFIGQPSMESAVVQPLETEAKRAAPLPSDLNTGSSVAPSIKIADTPAAPPVEFSPEAPSSEAKTKKSKAPSAAVRATPARAASAAASAMPVEVEGEPLYEINTGAAVPSEAPAGDVEAPAAEKAPAAQPAKPSAEPNPYDLPGGPEENVEPKAEPQPTPQGMRRAPAKSRAKTAVAPRGLTDQEAEAEYGLADFSSSAPKEKSMAAKGAPKPAPTKGPSGEKIARSLEGGTVSSNRRIRPFASAMTPALATVFLWAVPVILSGALTPEWGRPLAGLMATFGYSLSYKFAHWFDNRKAIGSKEVNELTFHKAAVGLTASAFFFMGAAPTDPLVWPILALQVAVVTVRHVWINLSVAARERRAARELLDEAGRISDAELELFSPAVRPNLLEKMSDVRRAAASNKSPQELFKSYPTLNIASLTSLVQAFRAARLEAAIADEATVLSFQLEPEDLTEDAPAVLADLNYVLNRATEGRRVEVVSETLSDQELAAALRSHGIPYIFVELRGRSETSAFRVGGLLSDEAYLAFLRQNGVPAAGVAVMTSAPARWIRSLNVRGLGHMTEELEDALNAFVLTAEHA